ncbi:MAG: hypothetical protein C0490_22605, partial [Marivirga sp.]|nr:hypothetical protein [Marivirga sp.]
YYTDYHRFAENNGLNTASFRILLSLNNQIVSKATKAIIALSRLDMLLTRKLNTAPRMEVRMFLGSFFYKHKL